MAKFLMDIFIHSRLLHIPVHNGSPRVILQISAGEKTVREFAVELAENVTVDWWAFYDMSAFHNQTVTLAAVDELPEEQAGWLAQSICQSDEILAADDLYHELYRPQFHFTARRGWNNDPNGLIYSQGEWHLFFQHNPFGVRWSNMHWGHAVSPDLVHWTELPEALYQKSLQDMMYSGGGLVDAENTAGWKAGPEDPLVVAFTSTGRGECLAYSLDCGRSLVEYPGNPVIAHQGRDPKIIWYEPGQHWIMIVYEEPLTPGVGKGGNGTGPSFGYAIYTSGDLCHWLRQSFLPDWYECPELFEAPVEGRPGVKKWVVYGCVHNRFNSAYMVGSFDGKVFTPEMEPAPAHFGPAFYAAQLFSQAPGSRKIMLGWLKGASYPEMPFSQGMTVPLELSLRTAAASDTPYRLVFNPVEELAMLSTDKIDATDLDLAQVNTILANAEKGELLDLEFDLDAFGPFSLWIGDYPLRWDAHHGEISFSGQSAAVPLAGGRLALRVLVDRSVTEVFAGRGWAAFAAMTLFPPGKRLLKLEGAVRAASLRIRPLKSIWN